jgi:LmbE family N-acetylglucosaminyl deacetylase
MNLSEMDYLPQAEVALFPGPWLVFAPHPDDETYGMGGSIARARLAGIDVRVVVLTDGMLGGEPGADLVRTRERETEQAVAALGGARLSFWRQPDRGLAPVDVLIARAARLLAKGGFGTAFFPSLVEPHPDHRAAAVIAWEALRRSGFPALPVSYDISTQGPCNRLLDVTRTVERKKQAMAIHASQEAQRPYARRVLALNRSRSWSLPDAVEYAESFFEFERIDCSLAEMLARIFLRYLRGLSGDDGAGPTLLPGSGQGDPDARIRNLQAQLDLLKASRCWRLTAPLRYFANRMRRLDRHR